MAEPVSGAQPTEPARDAELDDGRMPFLEHLVELRLRLRNACAGLAVGFVVAFFYSEEIYARLGLPLGQVWLELQAKNPAIGPPTFFFNDLTEPFFVYLSIGLWGGLFIASPLVFHQLWKFIAPGLYKRERAVGLVFAAVSAILFVGGALFCYQFVQPAAFRFFLGYSTTDLAATGSAASSVALAPLLGMDAYLSFTKKLLLAFGLVFELPLIITFMALAGMVTHRGLWRFNRWFAILAFVVAAILTPGPDVISQISMALPLIALYNLSIGVAWLITRRRERARA